MTLMNFLIVLAFNLYWLIDNGYRGYIDLYNGNSGKFLTTSLWVYAIWGIFNLIKAIT